MRRLALTALVLAFICAAAGAAKDENVADLKARVESSRPEDRAGLCIQVARQQLRDADKFYGEGNVEQANVAVNDVVAYSEKARDAATQTKKRLKNVEIDVRKMAEKLRDIKRTLAFDDQPPVDKAISRLEDVRTTLLKAMFAKDSKAKDNK